MSKKPTAAIAVIAAMLLLTGCKPGDDKAIELAHKEMADVMKDPSSVMFRNDKFVNRKDYENGKVTGYVCGELNAKNAYGAYVGFVSYIVDLEMVPKGTFSKGVEYKVLLKSMAPNGGHELQQFKQMYRQLCKAEAVAN
ncbi:TPA: hypothetical protein R4G38_003158 [Salmonella enterica subsp. enterica serovar Kentucky]|uniref:hypothetical protein n=1 Tax=Enterobacter hormaechei TaxID=158836 RepID=UPI0012734900|nr:hypothetical protein [Enterobacter hormaechei]EAR9329335.1 hypothetical protein [Salmonella enterica]EBS2684472.1 hypothetical protein [Salmonella enterica subsp. enterica serovar Montevideo]HED0044533.1 hypothetical protein [Salmonella enterica subsp. enterica serovar Kentucky]EAS2413100.1 hypothetical protein [Salmonella enterica]EIP2948926.1 hypothetical protein [Salmonella enterica]